MSRLLIRLTIVAVALYIVACYLASLLGGTDIWSQTYYLLFEICTCLCISKQGVYHCRYIKWTAYAIFLQDCLVTADVLFDFLPANYWVLAPPAIIVAGLATTLTLAIRHYIKVRKIKKIWRSKR